MTSEQVTKATVTAGRVEWLRNSMKLNPRGLRKPPGAGSRLSARAKSDAASAEAELNELFRLGDVPVGLDGPTDGVLVMTTMQAWRMQLCAR